MKEFEMKKLWLLLPMLFFWVSWFVGYNLIRPTPFSDWYGFPLLLSLTALNMVIIGFSIDKHRGT